MKKIEKTFFLVADDDQDIVRLSTKSLKFDLSIWEKKLYHA